MPQQTLIQEVSLTPAAIEAIRKILTQRKLDGYALRVYVTGNNCCGVKFGMTFDRNIQNTDTTFNTDGINIVVDEVSINFLRGASIDFVNDPQQGSGFLVNSPHAHNNEYGNCASENSCACN